MKENEPHDSIENAMEILEIEKKCNWDNLPNELKVMCIEKTDIKTRANLMLSNRHNKMLVELIKSKYPLSYVYFQDVRCFSRRHRCYEDFDFVVKSWRSTADYVSHKYEPRKLMDVLLNANIDELEFQNSQSLVKKISNTFTNVLAICNKKLSVKSLCFNAAHRADLDILQRCDEQLEQITLIFDRRLFYPFFEMLLGTPQVIAAERLTIRFLKYYPHDRLETVIDWLLVEADHDIGKEIIFQKEEPLWQFIMEVTETRRDFLHPTERIIRLRTKNPSKRVWAWLSEDDLSYFWINFLVSAEGSDAPNIKEIEKKRARGKSTS